MQLYHTQFDWSVNISTWDWMFAGFFVLAVMPKLYNKSAKVISM
jgi:hypothetical protein